MTNLFSRSALGSTLIAAVALGLASTAPAPAQAATPRAAAPSKPSVTRGGAPASADRPTSTMALSVGRGTLVNLTAPMSDLFVAEPTVADVQVNSRSQLYVFGKGPGETNVYATDKAGRVLWSSTVRVGPNLGGVGEMLKIAMPEAAITATPMNGMVLLTGTVATPDDIAEASRLAQAFVGEKTAIVTRLKTAVPLQVSLHVRIAEVSRSVSKAIGVNLLSADSTGGFQFGLGQGRVLGPQYTPGGPLGTGVTAGDPGTSIVRNIAPGTSIALAGKLLGLDILSAIDLAETDGLATTLAEPNLTALSGETASFLAGGEIPLPQSQGLGAVSVEYKQYGVSLAFTPIVLSDGRISLRVRPEVSQLSDSGSVKLNDFVIPALTTRRAETTIELGSGQSFMIGGLLQNSHNNTTDKAPFLGDLPILGALFRSNTFRKQETELVIIVTPYLVRPVDAQKLAMPTDGYRAASDAVRVIGGQPVASGVTPRAKPTGTAPSAPAGGGAPARAASGAMPAPGFSF